MSGAFWSFLCCCKSDSTETAYNPPNSSNDDHGREFQQLNGEPERIVPRYENIIPVDRDFPERQEPSQTLVCQEFSSRIIQPADPSASTQLSVDDDWSYSEQADDEEIEPASHFTTIVLLGETGVGKSTLVNGIVNYLAFESLAEAESSDLRYLIPSRFYLQNEEILIGDSDANENLNDDGASVTQRPKAYEFTDNGKNYRIIDVPGVGDSRGADQDRRNFDYILEEINKHAKISAFCILLPSDSARITVAMRYCLNELLANLHKDAARNIVFCFTKARDSFYGVGETYLLMEEHLRKLKAKRGIEIELNAQRTYFFDNEAFKYLCVKAKKHGFEAHRAEVTRSWEISKESALRLFEFVSALEPHDTRKMAELTKTKREILEMTSVATEVMKAIEAKRMKSASFRVNSSELQNGEERIQSICALFAAFLRQNSLSVANDEYIGFLKQAIAEEKQEVALGESGQRLVDLQNSLEAYTKQLKLLEDVSVKKEVTQAEIHRCKRKLSVLVKKFDVVDGNVAH